MPYAGTETGQFEPEVPKIEVSELDVPVESETDNGNKIKVSKIDGILRWIWSHPIKSVGSVIFAVTLNHYSEDIFSLIQGFVSMLFS